MVRRRRTPPPLTEAARTGTFSRRAVVIGAAQAGVGALLAARMGYISLVEGDRYTLLSESNRVNMTLIPPRRGWVVDYMGRALADNRVSLRIDIIPDRVQDGDALLGRLAELLTLSHDDIDRVRHELKSASGVAPVPVAQDVSEQEFAAVSVRLPELPGVAPARGFARNYPTGASVAHLVGYVGAPTAEQYRETRDPLYLTPGFRIGKDGLEKYYEPLLRGKPGAQRVEVTARGKVVRDLGSVEDVPGKTIHLTIDGALQDYASRRMGPESGAMVIIDCENGAVRSFVSMPAFDPNSFSDGIGRLEWKMLQEDDHIPLLNKASRGLYPPGSTVKMVAALAGLRAGIDPQQTVFCPGGYRLGNRFFRCLGRHGSVNMERAIEASCNTYFYSIGHRIGYDAIAVVARELGLGQEFPLPGSNQRYGTVPDSAWKMKRFKQAWTASDSLNAAIGQGYLSVSPLQLAVMAARIASGRKLMPFLAGKPAPAERLNFTEEQLAVVRRGMARVVNGNGTAPRARLALPDHPDVLLAGKTGTAQVRAISGGYRGKGGLWKHRDHGLFVCFAPTEKPRFAAACVIEHGMGGARAAAPVAKDVFTYMWEPLLAMERLDDLEHGWGGTLRERMDRKYAAYQAAATGTPPPAPNAAEGAAAPGTATPPGAGGSTTPASETQERNVPSTATPTGTRPASPPSSGTSTGTASNTPAAVPSAPPIAASPADPSLATQAGPQP